MQGKFIGIKILIWALIFLPACKLDLKRPDWLKGSSPRYPSEQYLIALGSSQASGKPAEDQSRSEENARSELAKELNTRFRSQLYLLTKEELSGLKPEEQSQVMERIQGEMSASQEWLKESIEVAERYYETRTETYYALAVLERKKVKDLVGARLNELEQKVAGLMELKAQSLFHQEGLNALSYLVQAEDFLIKELVLCSQYLVISGSAFPAKYHLSELKKEEAQIKKSIKLMVMLVEKSPSGKRTQVIESALRNGLERLGFSLVPVPSELRRKTLPELKNLVLSENWRKSSNADYLLLGSFQTKKLSQTKIQGKLYYFYQTGGELSLYNLNTGQRLLTMIDLSPEATKTRGSNSEEAISSSLEQAGKYFAELWSKILEQGFLKPPQNNY